MKEHFDDLNSTFNVDADIVERKKEKKKDIVPIKDSNEDIVKDYEYTRGNLYSIIEKGQEALDSALEIAVDGGQPRAYEVVAQLIKNVSDATDKIVDLQKKMKELDEENPKGKTTNVTNNAVFFGSTDELSKYLKNQKRLNDK